MMIMGHMKDIHKITTMIAMFAAVVSLSVGFIPEAVSQTSTLTVDLQPVCGFAIANGNVAIGNITPPANAVFTVNLSNSGSATLPVSANIGNSDTPGDPVGGFADGARTLAADIHILPDAVTINADDGIALNAVGDAQMVNAGTNVLIANLGPTGAQGEGSDRTATITVLTSNLQNTPAVGVQTATLTFTGGSCV